MRITVGLEICSARRLILESALRRGTILMATLLGATVLAAQTPAAPPASSATPKTLPHRVHSKSALTTPAPNQPANVPPVAPPAPNWPVNDRPTPATVTWDSHGLRIDAQNSSLQQILHDVASASGVRVDGMGSDQRVFGVYGPGQARDVLSQLLQGSGYNIMLIGDQGEGMPRQIVLSTRQTSKGPDTANRGTPENNDEDAVENDVEEQPAPAPVTTRPGFGQGDPARTPQQIMQEMQQRQQQMQQRNAPPNQ